MQDGGSSYLNISAAFSYFYSSGPFLLLRELKKKNGFQRHYNQPLLAAITLCT